MNQAVSTWQLCSLKIRFNYENTDIALWHLRLAIAVYKNVINRLPGGSLAGSTWAPKLKEDSNYLLARVQSLKALRFADYQRLRQNT